LKKSVPNPSTPAKQVIDDDNRALDILDELIAESPPYAPAQSDDEIPSPPFAPDADSFSPPFAPNDDSFSPPFAPNADSFSPPCAPNADSFSPPFAPEMDGGVEPFVKGENVFLRGGKKTNRMWRIRNVGGKFITIETDDMEGIDNFTDSIQVVSPNDIYRPSQIHMHEPMYNPNEMSQPFMQGIGPSKENDNSKCVFKPVINIVTGNNNQLDSTQPTESSINGEPLYLGGGSTSENMNMKEAVSSKTEASKSIEQNKTVDNFNPIDFTKGLIIKKT
jgi:hypothetical protein